MGVGGGGIEQSSFTPTKNGGGGSFSHAERRAGSFLPLNRGGGGSCFTVSMGRAQQVWTCDMHIL